MAGKLNLENFFRDASAVAALLPAAEVFGFLTRSINLPSAWAALACDEHGGQRAVAPGAVLVREGADEVLLVRVTPLDVHITEDGLLSKDRYQCRASLDLRLTLIPERSEMSSFRNALVGSASAVRLDSLMRHVQSRVRETMVGLAGESDAAALVDGAAQDAWAQALTSALQPVCFQAGMTLGGAPVLRFESPTLHQVRITEDRAALRRAEHQARRQLEEALETAQTAHLGHLESMLTRLKGLAEASPDVELPDLMRTFSERQRGELYEALFATEPARTASQWIVAATSEGLHFFAASTPDEPRRTVSIAPEVGGVRSVRFARLSDGQCVLMVGAARGVYEYPVEGAEPQAVFRAAGAREVRGGFNAVVVAGEHVWGSHSELGLLCWHRERPDAPQAAVEALTGPAQAVRGVAFHDGRIWCATDASVVALPADVPKAEPVLYRGSRTILTALAVGSGGVYAGNAEGEVLHWPLDRPDAPTVLHAGNHRPAESIHVLTTAGVDRLFFTDTSLAVYARVRGDSYACRYEAGGQTLRRVEVAPDVIVATNDVRDRLVCWQPSQPARPSAVVPVARLTRRSVQDVCLVSQA